MWRKIRSWVKVTSKIALNSINNLLWLGLCLILDRFDSSQPIRRPQLTVITNEDYDKERNSTKKPELTMLIVAKDHKTAKKHAAEAGFASNEWFFLDSISDVLTFRKKKCLVLTTKGWYSDLNCQRIVNLAAKKGFKII